MSFYENLQASINEEKEKVQKELIQSIINDLSTVLREEVCLGDPISDCLDDIENELYNDDSFKGNLIHLLNLMLLEKVNNM